MARTKVETVAGWRIPEPRPTLTAVRLACIWIGGPVLLAGGLLDLVMQFAFGVCTGLWCLAR